LPCLSGFSRCLTISRVGDGLVDAGLTGESTARFIALIERILAIIAHRVGLVTVDADWLGYGAGYLGDWNNVTTGLFVCEDD